VTEALPVALVTGATGGIGRVIVADLARTHRVIAVGRNALELSLLADLANVTAVAVDITDAAALTDLIAPLDRLDVLVHSAAFAERFTVESARPADWESVFAVNVFAPAELTRLALPLLRQSRGQVVFINSGAGLNGLPGHVVYSSSKFALKALADAVRREEEHSGVRVASVHPGPTSEGGRREDGDLRGKPESVAAAIRLVVDATEDTQITVVYVRPRVELGTS